ncbi:MAG: asparagine synthase B [Fusobacteriaceae bacterium]|jgi:asparagine synthase (glutamine-hydrolysing)|nr:asparagine synthase B [Fusobacteriaceae bacterium]
MCGFLVVGSDEYSLETFTRSLDNTAHRGPDNQDASIKEGVTWGFNRLSIMDLSSNGNQPFVYENCVVVCNGEIYNYPAIKKILSSEYNFKSGSDCEVLIPLYLKYGIETACKFLDSEFAMVMYDAKNKKMMAARDPMGIRPMFYGYSKKDKKICFSSEAKGLIDICDGVMPFPPGHYYDDGKFVCYNDISEIKLVSDDEMDVIGQKLKKKLETAVEKRLQSDAPIGYLLSGGLDSSLVCAIAAKLLKKPIRTFAIGMEKDPIDLKYAQQVADYIGSDHTEVIMTKEDVLGSLREVIYHLESWDITTIRASIGMYLLCKYIHKNTNLKVIMTGEVSDEIFGYKYTDFAPNPDAFQRESQKRLKELYMYDVLRADRCISANALEGRVPFADLDFVDYSMSIDPAKKMNTYNKGKYILRYAFKDSKYLPEEILFREKAAFSDAVGHSMVDYLKEYAENKYTEEDVKNAKDKYPYGTPFTKESLLYRDIFEEFYKGKAEWIKDFWMPNKEWVGCDVTDPSARVLKNYGDSGK